MKPTLFRPLAWLLILGTLSLLPNLSRAQGGQNLIQVLDGSLNQLRKDSSITVVDRIIDSSAFSSSLLTPYTIHNAVSFKVNLTSPYAVQSSFTANITLRIIYTDESNHIDSQSRTLSVGATLGSTGGDVGQSFAFANMKKVVVKVTDTSSNANWNCWKLLAVTNEMQTFPQFSFNCSTNSVQSVAHQSLSANTTADTLYVSWGNIIYADEYDLEWTYLDSSAISQTQYNQRYGADSLHLNPALIFADNATRVTIASNNYNIPLLYDGAGRLFFRVRSVHRQAGGGRSEGKWSSDTTASGLGTFDFKGHQRNLNWQANTSFAEGGKRKSVVQYFDGSLRSRQTVTKDNSTDSIVVAETFYDYQGRPAVQVLPAPTLSTAIAFTKNFNRGYQASEYYKSSYDALSDPSQYCATGAGPMDTTSGAGQYYSPANPSKNYQFNKFIPDATGDAAHSMAYAFAETQYTQDNTGRIAKQGGVGPAFQIGTGHETRYYYGIPDQRELDALFGTEVGDHNHYFKTMVRDANGQYSVSYTDMHGRTIATALAGAPADSFRLAKLPSYKFNRVTETIADSTTNITKDLVMESKKALVVPVASTDTFQYSLTPQLFSDTDCSNLKVCYDCLYDLEIIIADDCNNASFGGQPFDTVVHNFSLSSQAPYSNCDSARGFSFSFVKSLAEGSYTITKRLSVNRSGSNYLRDSVFTPRNTCTSLATTIQNTATAIRSSLVCAPTCSSCRADIGTWASFRDKFIANTGAKTAADSAYWLNAAQVAYNQAVADCDALCGITSEVDDIKQQMLLDLTPPTGQYADLTRKTSLFSIFYTGTGTRPAVAPYASITNYKDVNGQPDSVYDESTGLFTAPQNLSPSAFTSKFKLSWADALLSLHPEACKYNLYTALAGSNPWDRRFESCDSYDSAMAYGYLDPLGITTGDFTRYMATGTADYDPIAAYAGHDYKTPLQNIIDSYTNNSITAGRQQTTTSITMWTLATGQVLCSEKDSSCLLNYQTAAQAFPAGMCAGDKDMAWRAFREMYLQAKRTLVVNQAESSCSPSAKTILDSNFQPHFTDGLSVMTQKGYTVPTTQAGAYAFRDQQAALVTAQYASNCQAYVSSWMQDLQPCGFDATTLSRIDSALVTVCTQGSDASHPYGASSVNPNSKNRFRSFEDVIQFYKDSLGGSYSNDCSAYTILAPKPYDQQVVYAAKPVYSRPDTCDCNQISRLYNDYQTRAANFTSFSDYLQKTRNTTMSAADLTQLLNSCAITSNSCIYLKQPILLPPALQCSSGDVCTSCASFRQLGVQFKTKYPSLNPHSLTDPQDSTTIKANRVYERFLNYKLGFSYTVEDYFAFGVQCAGSAEVNADTLQNFLNSFQYSGKAQHDFEAGSNYVHYRDLHDIEFNGAIHLPDSIRSNTSLNSWYNNYHFRISEHFCWDSGYSFEYRMKFLVDKFPLTKTGDLVSFDAGEFNFLIQRENAAFTSNGTTYSAGTYLVQMKNAYNTVVFWQGMIRLSSDSNALTNFCNIKARLQPTQYSVYWNDSLVLTAPRTAGAVTINQYTNLNIFSAQGAIDWIKIYDRYGAVRYFEDFNDPDNPAFPDINFMCPPPNSCQSVFATEFTRKTGLFLTYGQIDSLYQAVLGIRPNPCGGSTDLTKPDPCNKFTFQKAFATTGPSSLRLLTQTSDQGYILGGYAQGVSIGHGSRDAWLIRTDKRGRLIWSKLYGGKFVDLFSSIKQTPDSGFIAVGSTNSFNSPAANQTFVTKTNKNGSVEWTRGFKNTVSGEYGVDVVCTRSDSGYAVLGTCTNSDSTTDIVVIKLTATGSLSWAGKYGTKTSDYAGGIVEDQDTLVIAGSSDTTSPGSRTNPVLFKIKKTGGAPIWTRFYDLHRNPWSISMVKSNSGYRLNLLMGTDISYSDANPAILDVDRNGKIRWVDSIPKAPGFTLVNGADGTTTPDNGCIFTEPVSSSSLYNIVFHKLDSNGSMQWTRKIARSNTQLYRIIQNADGSFTGIGYDSSGNLLVKLDSLGLGTCNDSTISMSAFHTDTISVNRPFSFTSVSYDSISINQASLNAITTVKTVCSNDSCAPAGSTLPTLCGRYAPVFAPVIDSFTNCSDSTFFAVSIGTDRYNYYIDSLNTGFDSAYRAKCLNAYKYEKFTVAHAASEFHYTLYYYDQAGNLLKTVAPEGVQANYNASWLDSVATARNNRQQKVPAHVFVTQYRYNSLNQVTSQKTPDAGKANFWYDRLGRLAISQNARQRNFSGSETGRGYSYTGYDYLGRITEVGQIRNAGSAPMTDSISRRQSLLDTWILASAAAKEQITTTVYDAAYTPALTKLVQRNLRNRVSYTSYTPGNNSAQFDNASFFTYDILGNVDTLLRDFGSSSLAASQNPMNTNANRWKKLVYNYDLISGKVNSLVYQPNAQDMFIHRYSYDAENRLTQVDVSDDSLFWETKAQYFYYRHGPLARMTLGSFQTQGLDYAYTLQGWLKGVNATSVNPSFDMGQDGYAGVMNAYTGRDAYSYSLNYFAGDYRPINAGVSPFPGTRAYLDTFYHPLYNGNIGSSTVNLPALYASDTVTNQLKPILYSYQYDQLNRLVAQDAFVGLNQQTNDWTSSFHGLTAFRQRLAYDGNGNIVKNKRTVTGNNENLETVLDSLGYLYNAGTNLLSYIKDQSSYNSGKDLQNQPAGNYRYDSIGNLTSDSLAGVPSSGIDWNVYGKVVRADNTSASSDTRQMRYGYDASSNKIWERQVKRGSATVNWRYYVRDAAGNILSTYTLSKDSTSNPYTGTLNHEDQYLYGSARIGDRSYFNQSINNADNTTLGSPWTGSMHYHHAGLDQLELTNHLGNVLIVLADRKLPVPKTSDPTLVDYYKAVALQAQDYMPFGDLTIGRTLYDGYKFGFNGKQHADEIRGPQYDYGARLFDPRVGRFLSVDPISKKYPELTPYQYASNKPISSTDIDGLEEWELNSQAALLKREAEYRSGQLKNPSFKTPIRFQPTINATTPAQMRTAQEYTAQVNMLNRAYNSDASFSIQIFMGIGAAADSYYPEVRSTISAANNISNGNYEEALSDLATAGIFKTIRSYKFESGQPASEISSQLKINRARSEISEEIVFKRLETSLKPGEAILREPRIYIGDGSSGEYAIPDFAVYNIKTGQFSKIVDAKDGGGSLTGLQKKLNEQGGVFRGSSRAPDAAPQKISPNSIQIERTNVTNEHQ